MDLVRQIVNAITPSAPLGPSSSSPYNPSPRDTVRVRSYLIHLKLPTELALAIVDYAQYYPIIRGHSDVELRVSASRFQDVNAATLCVVTEPIPAVGDGERIKRKTVKFKLRSHDQGWGGDPGCRGTYAGSYTWFEASILRPSGSPRTETIPAHLTISPRPTTDCLERYHFSLVQPPNSAGDPAWRIQANMCASPEERFYKIDWQEGHVFNPSPGTGDGQGFLEALQPGDRIGVWARAQYPGWENRVKEVDVELLLEID